MKVFRGAATVLVAVGLAACSSSTASGAVNFASDGSTHYLKGGEYAVSVADDCGTTVMTVAAYIAKAGWTSPLLNGTPVAIPQSGSYTVHDPIGDIGNAPSCELALTVALTPLKG